MRPKSWKCYGYALTAGWRFSCARRPARAPEVADRRTHVDPLEVQLQALLESVKVSPENVPLRRLVSDTFLKLGRHEEAEQRHQICQAGEQGDDAHDAGQQAQDTEDLGQPAAAERRQAD